MLSSSLAKKRVVVLGAGIVGLLTAQRLLELSQQPPIDVTIVAESFDNDTTSDGAGGLFRPDARFMAGVPIDLAKQWCVESFSYFHRLMMSAEGGKAGVFQMSGYQLFDDLREDPSYKDIIYQFRHLTQQELDSFPKRFKYGYFSTTLCIDPRLHMKYVTELLKEGGVKFVRKRVTSLEVFVEEQHGYDIVFNCLGIGAKGFCHDMKLVPIRGQMIRVQAPWIKHFYYTDDNCYIIPNVNNVCLGGTRQIANDSLVLDENDSKGILQRCKELCPSLERATIDWEWVGLRPHREPTRVEKEIVLNSQGKRLIMIHNYGHGGNGIALSRGTVVHAVDMLMEEHNANTKSHL